MRILELPSYLFPEKFSHLHLSEELQDAYNKAGIQATIIAPMPCRGVCEDVRKQYKKKKYEERFGGKVKITRFSMFKEPKNPVFRAIRYLLIHWKQYWKSIKLKDIDVLFSISTPPTAGLLMSLVKKRLSKKYGHRVSFVYSVNDVFPESMVYTGLTKKDSFIYKIGKKVSAYTYKNVDKIIAISEDVKDRIMEMGVPEHKISIIRNWIDTEAVIPIAPSENQLMKELEIDEKRFKVVYAGNMGMAQGVHTIVEAAELMKDDDIEFIFFGEGAEKENIENKIKQKNLKNIKMYPLQSVERVAETYSTGDVCIVSCKKGTGKSAFPSKMVSIIATATPIIASFDTESEMCRLIEQYDCGICVEPESAEKLVQAIRYMNMNREDAQKKGKNGRQLAINMFQKEKCTEKYIEVIMEALKKVSDED